MWILLINGYLHRSESSISGQSLGSSDPTVLQTDSVQGVPPLAKLASLPLGFWETLDLNIGHLRSCWHCIMICPHTLKWSPANISNVRGIEHSMPHEETGQLRQKSAWREHAL